MAKKTKRKVSTVVTPAAAPEVMTVSSAESPAASAALKTPGRRSGSSTVEFNPDYSYVVKDLKRIGIMAGTFFALLIVLSFFIK
jgi:hypothetical protein